MDTEKDQIILKMYSFLQEYLKDDYGYNIKITKNFI